MPSPIANDGGARVFGFGVLPAWVDREELAQVVELARLEAIASGFDPAVAAADAVEDFVSATKRRFKKERPATDTFSSSDPTIRQANATLAWVADADRVVGLSPPKEQTAGQKLRFRRNQVIFAATLAGFSQRTLARLFGLPHSRIAAIVKEMRRKTGIDGPSREK